MAHAFLVARGAGGLRAALGSSASSPSGPGGAAAAKRLLSAQAKPAQLRQYLDAWMGSTRVNPIAAAAMPGAESQAQEQQQQQQQQQPPLVAVSGGTPLTVAGKSYLVPTLRLPRGVSPEALRDGIKATTSLSAGYFQSAPIVLDVFEWAQATPRAGPGAGMDELDGALLRTFIRALKEAGLHPVGIANATASDLQSAALEEGLPCFMGRHTPAAAPSAFAPAAPATEQSPSEQPSQLPEPAAGRGRVSSAAYRRRNSVVREAAKQQASRTSSALGGAVAAEMAIEDEAEGEGEGEDGEAANERAAAAAQPTKVVQGSVRTGQQVFAEGCSLVVLGHVNSGAEVSADGDIHVYGKLTGRVLAGLSGDPTARIFAGRFNAELVAIGDVFTTCDQLNDLPGAVLNAPTTISLDSRSRELSFRSFKV